MRDSSIRLINLTVFLTVIDLPKDEIDKLSVPWGLLPIERLKFQPQMSFVEQHIGRKVGITNSDISLANVVNYI